MERSFWVSGKPATFATKGEGPWRERLKAQIPRNAPAGAHHGLSLRFVVPTLAPQGHGLDVDNLCEPVFSELINRAGWFGGRRPNLRHWTATKEQGSTPGCRIDVLQSDGPRIPEEGPLVSGVYNGPLPSSAKEPEPALWATGLREQAGLSRLPRGDLALYLGFGSTRVNIGSIATGKVKSLIDCLYPLLGGQVSAPADHRIHTLYVGKGNQNVGAGRVEIRLWCPV